MKSLWINSAAIYCLFGFSNAVFKLLATSEEGVLAPWFLVYFASVVIISIIFIFSKSREVIFLLTKNKILVLVLVYMLLSSLWAIDVELGFITAVRCVIAALFGLYIATRYSEKELLAIIAITMAIIAISSLLLGMFLPEYGRIQDGGPNDGAWQGAFTSRNGFGIFMNIAFFIFMASARYFTNWRHICYILAFLALALVILSGSMTSLFMFILIACLPLILPLVRKYGFLMLTSGTALICCIGLVFALAEIKPDVAFLFKALGKDPTLSGRAETWSSVRSLMLENKSGRLLFGYGAADPNITTSGQIVTEASAKEVKRVYPADADLRAAWPIDNTYINICLKFGMIGCIIFSICIARALVIAFNEVRIGSMPMQNFYMVIMLILLINGITESVDRQTLLWIFFAIILAKPYASRLSDD